MVLEIIGLEIVVPDLIWTIINFFILFFLLKIFLFKPLLAFMDKREKKIMDGISKGLKAQEEMDAAEAEALRQIDESNAEAKSIVEAARKNGEIQKEASALEAREQARLKEEDSIKSIETEKENMRRKVNENMPEYVSMLTRRLLGEGKN